MYTLGIDVGSSSVKVSLLNLTNGKCVASAFYPSEEMPILAVKAGWAEQEPLQWWENMKNALADVLKNAAINKAEIKAIGISYQMHGLVALDKNGDVVRPSIIWCDSRAVEIGDKAFKELGSDYCLNSCLNSPGNFTASKLKWVKENEPELYATIDKIMLPGDYIAYRLTGEKQTTVTGLSEGIMWDFKKENVANDLFDYYGFSSDLIPEIVPVFSEQAKVSDTIAAELGIPAGIPVSYRAGDQPNNAFSLNVLEPGEVAATAGTSGVVYGVNDRLARDEQSRVNTFAHVNHNEEQKRLGVLLCINGTGILNSWLRRNVAGGIDYPAMNDEAMKVSAGADGLLFYPFGNGAERVLGNANPGAELKGLSFNIHNQSHVLRAAQEGIAFSFRYGVDIMGEMGIKTSVVRAGKANMFLSPLFRQTMANVLGAKIELYDTDGALGAARGAALGAGLYKNASEAFDNLTCLETIQPNNEKNAVEDAYKNWKFNLKF
ncbi:xylulokinase [Alkalitalea saponilacus]|uniref:Xylulokinase n=1 Tax=Alkalitalea saponilacus TaxID=889453 RepID=A0A1T5HSI1_9BACT|nr:FGGY family carbohydrate kinase [Alkalitalea saponilacus]SKC23649.1 xylulokinase [Alkalitalea saponilacus]